MTEARSAEGQASADRAQRWLWCRPGSGEASRFALVAGIHTLREQPMKLATSIMLGSVVPVADVNTIF